MKALKQVIKFSTDNKNQRYYYTQKLAHIKKCYFIKINIVIYFNMLISDLLVMSTVNFIGTRQYMVVQDGGIYCWPIFLVIKR